MMIIGQVRTCSNFVKPYFAWWKGTRIYDRGVFEIETSPGKDFTALKDDFKTFKGRRQAAPRVGAEGKLAVPFLGFASVVVEKD
jgi:hypothetical protein